MRSDAREAAFQIVFADLFGGDGKKDSALRSIKNINSKKTNARLQKNL